MSLERETVGDAYGAVAGEAVQAPIDSMPPGVTDPMLAAVPDLLCEIDADGTILRYKPGAGLAGDGAPSLVGRNIHELAEQYLPEEEAMAAREGLLRTLETGQPHHLVFKRVTKAGALRVYDARARRGPLGQVFTIIRAIPDERPAAHALSESDDLYRAVVEEQTALICRALPDTTIVLVNEAYCRNFNRTLDELVGTRFIELIPECDRDALLQHLAGLTPARPKAVIEHRVTLADGRTGWNRWVNRAFFDEAGRIVEIQSVGEDITARHRAELAFRESQSRYKALVNNIGIGIYRSTAKGRGRFLEANPALARMLGYDSMEEFMHCPVADLYQDPADRATLVREASAAGHIRRKELRLKKKDGTLLWATCTATVFRDPEGHILWMDGVVEDITALKQAEKALRDSEQKHRTLVHALAEGIWVMDERDITTLVNPHMAAMLGYTEQEMVGRPVFDFMDEQGAAICKRNIEARKQGIAETHEFELIDKKGRRHYVVMGTAPLTNSKGEYAGAIASVRDETEMKRTKEEREFLATTLLEVQEQERQAISATLHDDLGQVLTLAKMELSSLPSGSYPSAGIEKTMARLDEALASVRRMAVSLRPPLLDDIGLKAAIESLVEDMSDSSGIRVSLSVEGVCPVLGKKAETCIFRVLQEALTNVVRHSGAAHAEVTLRAIGPECRIEVADDGTGFNTLDYAKGLGLLGMRERLEHLGGTLHVTSTPAQGTRVIAVVPHAASLDKDPDHD